MAVVAVVALVAVVAEAMVVVHANAEPFQPKTCPDAFGAAANEVVLAAEL